MEIINRVVSWFLKKRINQLEFFIANPEDVQFEVFRDLIGSAEETIWGLKYSYKDIKTYEDFNKNVPISEYDDIKPYIEMALKGMDDVLWPGTVKWFAKSSGTTSDKSKLIPVTEESLEECHYKAGKDMLALYYHQYPDSEILDGKTIGVAGSTRPTNVEGMNSFEGDLSAILMNNLPIWAHITKTPNLAITTHEDFNEKVKMISEITRNEDVRTISGVPSWMLVILKKVLSDTNHKTLKDLWPKFELVVHGGVSFQPYKKQFEELAGRDIRFWEVYNASEGFIAVQDAAERDDMLLMLDYGIFYEFISIKDWNAGKRKAIEINSVEIGVDYVLIMSTNAGLWRYAIGDTIVFTSLYPHRIKITGRIKSFINVAGEELMVGNADAAIQRACEQTHALVKEYTAAPFQADDGSLRHQWLFEFEKAPLDMEFFAHVLDTGLQARNSDYEAKRFQDMVLKPPMVQQLKSGSFMKWLQYKNKLGGQNKIPRLSNDRAILDEILSLTNELYV